MEILRILGKLIFKRYSKLVSTLLLILFISLIYIFACWSIFLSFFELCYDLLVIWGVYHRSIGSIGFEYIPFHHLYTLIVALILKKHCQSFRDDLNFYSYYPELENLSQTRDSFSYSVYVILDDYLLNHGDELYQRIMMVYLAIWGLLFFYFASEFFFDFLDSFFEDS